MSPRITSPSEAKAGETRFPGMKKAERRRAFRRAEGLGDLPHSLGSMMANVMLMRVASLPSMNMEP